MCKKLRCNFYLVSGPLGANFFTKLDSWLPEEDDGCRPFSASCKRFQYGTARTYTLAPMFNICKKFDVILHQLKINYRYVFIFYIIVIVSYGYGPYQGPIITLILMDSIA
jgi:hypothetical protein